MALEKSLITSEIADNSEPVFRRYHMGDNTVAGVKPPRMLLKRDDFDR
jgi:hypothetical protein